MSLTRDYKEANRTAKITFEKRYSDNIRTSTQDIRDRYGIAADSKLSKVVENSLRKFLVALDERQNAYNQWYRKNQDSLRTLEDAFGKPLHSNAVLLVRAERYKGEETESFLQLLRIDRGRSNVVLNTTSLIARHQEDITDPVKKRKSDRVELLLGSIIRQAINIYYETNGNETVVSFSNSPQQTVEFLGNKLNLNK